MSRSPECRQSSTVGRGGRPSYSPSRRRDDGIPAAVLNVMPRPAATPDQKLWRLAVVYASLQEIFARSRASIPARRKKHGGLYKANSNGRPGLRAVSIPTAPVHVICNVARCSASERLPYPMTSTRSSSSRSSRSSNIPFRSTTTATRTARCAFLNCPKATGSLVSAKSPGRPKRTRPSTEAPRTARTASSLRSKMRRAYERIRSPDSVRTRPRP